MIEFIAGPDLRVPVKKQQLGGQIVDTDEFLLGRGLSVLHFHG